jgi:hypothetical protein
VYQLQHLEDMRTESGFLKYCTLFTCQRSRVAQSVIVSDYGLDDRAIGFRSPARAKNFSSVLCVQIGSGAHPVFCPMGTGGPFPGGKALSGRDPDHSPLSSAGIMNELELYFPPP